MEGETMIDIRVRYLTVPRVVGPARTGFFVLDHGVPCSPPQETRDAAIRLASATYQIRGGHEQWKDDKK